MNVDRARPLFAGHAQPAEPGELGRYDLSDVKVMKQQAELPLEHGVEGFVMHHYWFDGKPLLDTPLKNLLADPEHPVPVRAVLGQRELDPPLGRAGQRTC